jgi:hypothetical protein
MNLAFSKTAILLLLPVFLIASVGGAFGYTWCFGDDGHVEVKYVTLDGCCDGDLVNSDVARYDVPTIHQPDDDHCGSCLDFSTQQNEIAFFKRLKRTPSVSTKVIAPNGFSPILADNAKLVVGHLMSQPPLRTSQTILAHRTVVLLN